MAAHPGPPPDARPPLDLHAVFCPSAAGHPVPDYAAAVLAASTGPPASLGQLFLAVRPNLTPSLATPPPPLFLIDQYMADLDRFKA
jgi:hypothetical protein